MKKSSINPFVPTTFFLLIIVILFISALALKNYMIDQEEQAEAASHASSSQQDESRSAMEADMADKQAQKEGRIGPHLAAELDGAAADQKFAVRIILDQTDQFLLGRLKDDEIRVKMQEVTLPVLQEVSRFDPEATALDYAAAIDAELTAEQIHEVAELQDVMSIVKVDAAGQWSHN